MLYQCLLNQISSFKLYPCMESVLNIMCSLVPSLDFLTSVPFVLGENKSDLVTHFPLRPHFLFCDILSLALDIR